VRVKDLKPQDKMVRVERNGANGKVFPAPTKVAICLSNAKGIAASTIKRQDGTVAIEPHLSTKKRTGKDTSNTDTDCILTNTTGCLKSKVVNAQSANNRPARTSAPIGAASCALTIATTQKGSEDCFAMIATSWLDTAKSPKSLISAQSTYKLTCDEIVDISHVGVEDVFDIEVERTANFIADGVVSHNTRWHQDDLSGGILPVDWNGESGLIKGRDGLDWFVLCLPAICDRAARLVRGYGLNGLVKATLTALKAIRERGARYSSSSPPPIVVTISCATGSWWDMTGHLKNCEYSVRQTLR
jgi:hypothetical protein